MKNLIIFLVAASILSVSIAYPTWTSYKTTYNKTYSTSEDPTRQGYYNQTLLKLALAGLTYTTGVNTYSDWSSTQLANLRGVANKSSPTVTTPYVNYSSPAAALNWVDKNDVTAVKNQGVVKTCAADWAFAAVAYAESKLIIDGRYDKTVNLAQQQVLQCTSGSSCTVGYVEDAMTTVTNGLLFTSLYSYDPTSTHIGICKIPGVSIGTKTQNYYNINDNQIIQLLQERPVVAVVASKNWQYYSSGIFTCGATDVADHAVLIVGYTADAWIIKNSWGTGWGQSGFIRVSRTSGVNCKVGAVVSRTWGSHLITLLSLCLFVLALISV